MHRSTKVCICFNYQVPGRYVAFGVWFGLWLGTQLTRGGSGARQGSLWWDPSLPTSARWKIRVGMSCLKLFVRSVAAAETLALPQDRHLWQVEWIAVWRFLSLSINYKRSLSSSFRLDIYKTDRIRWYESLPLQIPNNKLGLGEMNSPPAGISKRLQGNCMSCWKEFSLRIPDLVIMCHISLPAKIWHPPCHHHDLIMKVTINNDVFIQIWLCDWEVYMSIGKFYFQKTSF